MSLFDFLKKDKRKTTEVALKCDDDDKSPGRIGAGVALDASIRSSTAQANAKYSRPAYNPQTRKQFYDDAKAHKKAVDNAFASGKTVKDPYSGAELVKKQREYAFFSRFIGFSDRFCLIVTSALICLISIGEMVGITDEN